MPDRARHHDLWGRTRGARVGRLGRGGTGVRRVFAESVRRVERGIHVPHPDRNGGRDRLFGVGRGLWRRRGRRHPGRGRSGPGDRTRRSRGHGARRLRRERRAGRRRRPRDHRHVRRWRKRRSRRADLAGRGAGSRCARSRDARLAAGDHRRGGGCLGSRHTGGRPGRGRDGIRRGGLGSGGRARPSGGYGGAGGLRRGSGAPAVKTEAENRHPCDHAEGSQEEPAPVARRPRRSPHHLVAKCALCLCRALLFEPAQGLQDGAQPSFPPVRDAASLGTT
jgi:hypothetical protein